MPWMLEDEGTERMEGYARWYISCEDEGTGDGRRMSKAETRRTRIDYLLDVVVERDENGIKRKSSRKSSTPIRPRRRRRRWSC